MRISNCIIIFFSIASIFNSCKSDKETIKENIEREVTIRYSPLAYHFISMSEIETIKLSNNLNEYISIIEKHEDIKNVDSLIISIDKKIKGLEENLNKTDVQHKIEKLKAQRDEFVRLKFAPQVVKAIKENPINYITEFKYKFWNARLERFDTIAFKVQMDSKLEVMRMKKIL